MNCWPRFSLKSPSLPLLLDAVAMFGYGTTPKLAGFFATWGCSLLIGASYPPPVARTSRPPLTLVPTLRARAVTNISNFFVMTEGFFEECEKSKRLAYEAAGKKPL